ncbi:class II histocompatibility antigen, B-L beta chain-like, partial [Corapipo altera]|uniref:class II histocompatibility antigen, B-L beta chain-like n=1 Tax=Corapipo altera TaxID=415028 RepID=UPI000FD63659
MFKVECHFINGTEQVMLVNRYIYNREQYVHFDSNVGVHVGDTPYGEKFARDLNSQPEFMEHTRSAVDTVCRHNYELSTPFLVNRRVPPSVSISLVPSSSQPARLPPEMPPDTVRSKILVGVGGFVLGLVFLAL